MTRILTLFALLVVWATPAIGAPVVAIEDDLVFHLTDPAQIDTRTDLIASTGVKYTRLGLDWNHVAPTRPANPDDPADPAYDWSRYDRMITNFRRRGIGTMVTLNGTPPWASTSGKWNASPRIADGAAFAGAVARRYNGSYPAPAGGTLPAIKTISVRNEPNIYLFTTPQCARVGNRWAPVSPTFYAALLTASEPKIRAANPDVLIVAGETGSTKQESGGCKNAITTIGTFEFTRLLHKQLGGGRDMPFDMWAQHLYPVGPPDRAAFFPSWRSLPGLTKLLNKMHPTNRMPLIISETGYTTSYSPYHRYFASEAQQAKWVDLTYKVAAKNTQVELVVWFNMQDHRNWPAGLFRADLSRKPSFSRFRALATRTPLSAKWALP